MPDLKTAQDMMAAAVAGKDTTDPEVTSVKQLLKLLDKASKNVRTFGQQNPVAQKFFQQFSDELAMHLGAHTTLSFLVQRSELYFKEQVVYGSATDASSENLAFKLYADGIRELTFHEGIANDDLAFFLDALWGSTDPVSNQDDDIVTRLWEKNLPTISVVTANDVMKISGVEDVTTPKSTATLGTEPSSLREVVAQEQAKQTKEGDTRHSRVQPTVTGYELSAAELAVLAQEIQTESARDNITYILDMLTAILASERSPVVLSKLFDAYDEVLDSLTRHGHWVMLEHALCLLFEVNTIRPDLTDKHKQKVQQLIDKLGSPDRIKLIEQYLTKSEKSQTDGLSTVLLMTPPSTVPALCALLGNLQDQAQQVILCDAIVELGKNAPEAILRHLTDRRPAFVRNLLSIVGRWNDPRHADAIEKIGRYPDPVVRRDIVRLLGQLRPNGSGTKLVGYLVDADEGVRLAAFKLLLSGNYSTLFSVWAPLVTAEDFGDRPPAERRNIFHAMRATARDEAVPYWSELLTDWGWTNRKKREELALLAADALGKLATPAAVAALEIGRNKGSSTVKRACAAALITASKQADTK